MRVFRSHTVSTLTEENFLVRDFTRLFLLGLEFREIWKNKTVMPNIQQLCMLVIKSKDSVAVTHLGCFSVCSFGVEKKIVSFVVVEPYPFKTATVKIYTRFQAKKYLFTT